MHANSYQLFKKHALPLITSDMDVLEISPDEPGEPYAIRNVLPGKKERYYYANMENTGSLGMEDEYSFACRDNLFDVVLSANLTIAAGKKLTLRGNCKVNNCQLILSAGAILEFDSSLASSPSSGYMQHTLQPTGSRVTMAVWPRQRMMRGV